MNPCTRHVHSLIDHSSTLRALDLNLNVLDQLSSRGMTSAVCLRLVAPELQNFQQAMPPCTIHQPACGCLTLAESISRKPALNGLDCASYEATENQHAYYEADYLIEMSAHSPHASLRLELPLKRIPSKITRLDQLSALSINVRDLRSFGLLTRLTRLRSIRIGGHGTTIPAGLGRLSSLTHLVANFGKLSSVDFMQDLEQLRTAVVGFNEITSVGDLRRLTALRTLSFLNNKLSGIHAGHLPLNLTTLSLDGNEFHALPDLSGQSYLKELSMGGNRLTSLAGIGSLSSLIKLNLNANALTGLEELRPLKNLRILEIVRNPLASLPPPLPSLRLLNLETSGLFTQSVQEAFLESCAALNVEKPSLLERILDWMGHTG